MRGNFSITGKKTGADCAQSISDIKHFKKTTQIAGEEATETDTVPRKEEMTGGQRSTVVFVFHHQILIG